MLWITHRLHAYPQQVDVLESNVKAARSRRDADPQSAEAHFNLASALHLQDYHKPDGGRRVPEAEAAYRCQRDAIKKQF